MSGEPGSARLREAAIAQVVLEGVALPAERGELLEYARRQRAPASVLAALAAIPARSYERIDDVGEAISATQPSFAPPPVHQPQVESGELPGGPAYLDGAPEPGAIREPPRILPHEEQLVREPAPVGESAPKKGTPSRKLGAPKSSARAKKEP